MDMNWLMPKNIEELWGSTQGHIKALYRNLKIDRVIKIGRTWLIPREISKPVNVKQNLQNPPRAAFWCIWIHV